MHELTPHKQTQEQAREWDELEEASPTPEENTPEGAYIEDRLRDLIEQETGKSAEEFLEDVEQDAEQYAA